MSIQQTRLTRLLLCGSLAIALLAPQARAAEAEEPSTQESEASTAPTAKVVAYEQKDEIPVKTKLRYTTLIVLPKNEQILDFTCGDKEFWIVNGNQNFAYVKPAKEGARTNLNLVTASGNIYSFVLSEISGSKAEPDLKIFVELKDQDMRVAAESGPKFVSAQELEKYKEQLQAAKDETRSTQEAAQAAIEQGVRHFIDHVRFPYRFEAGKKPFYVRSMYHDDRFTYIQARPEETPTLYEIKDGKPNLVNFQYKDGLYVVDKIVTAGYLAIGKQKLEFTSEE